MNDSYFDGNTFQLIGYNILGGLITILTLGICFPIAKVMIERWKAKHTVIEGRRLYFDGSAMQLFGLWIKWFFLIIITLGIYTFFVVVDLEKWRVKHTRFMM